MEGLSTLKRTEEVRARRHQGAAQPLTRGFKASPSAIRAAFSAAEFSCCTLSHSPADPAPQLGIVTFPLLHDRGWGWAGFFLRAKGPTYTITWNILSFMSINPQINDVCVGDVHTLLTRVNNPPLVGISQHLVLFTFFMHRTSTKLSENTSLALTYTYLQEHIVILEWVRRT